MLNKSNFYSNFNKEFAKITPQALTSSIQIEIAEAHSTG